MPRHWLIKSEPSEYPFSRLLRERRTVWDGVRNFEARNNLRAMQVGDLCLYYHSMEDKAVVGVARVRREAYPDPTAPGEDWSAVDVEPVQALASPVTLAAVKAQRSLSDIALVKRARLSVVPVSEAHFDTILRMGSVAPSPAAQRKSPRAKKRRGPLTR